MGDSGTSSQHSVVHPGLVVIVAAVAILLLANVITTGFEKLGIPRGFVVLILLASVAGSVVNIPLRRREFGSKGGYVRFGGLLFYRAPKIEHQVLAINVGGGLVPVALSIWLLWHTPLVPVAFATLCIALLTHRLAKVQPGSGIVMPTLIPPLVAVGIALVLAGGRSTDAAAIAYVSGSMGCLIGADILNLRRLEEVGPGVLSIGGAGVFDGVFLVGIIAALLA